jgi:hypothetical protein
MPYRDLSLSEQENVRSLIRVLRARFGNWVSVERVLPISHGVRVDVMAGRHEVSTAIAFRVAKAFDASLYDVIAGTVLPPNACPHCGKPIER